MNVKINASTPDIEILHEGSQFTYNPEKFHLYSDKQRLPRQVSDLKVVLLVKTVFCLAEAWSCQTKEYGGRSRNSPNARVNWPRLLVSRDPRPWMNYLKKTPSQAVMA